MLFIKTVFLLLVTISFNFPLLAQRTQQAFDESWKFTKGHIALGENVNLNESDWRNVDLPTSSTLT